MIPDSRFRGFMAGSRRRAPGRAVVVGLVLSALGVAAACHKVPLLAPSGATIKLYTSTQVLPINGTTQVTAAVVESSGNPVQDGTQVTFTSSLGTFTPNEVGTTNGKATVTFNAGSQSGTAVINAFSGATGTSGGTSSTGSVTILIGAAAMSNVLLTANPSSVSQLGGSSTITATVVDQNNNPLNGILVSFSTSQGTVSPVSAQTDAQGQAQTQLTTNQSATVTATAGSKFGTVMVTAVPVPTVTLAASTTAPTALVATTFTLSVAAGSGASPITSVLMDFGDSSTIDLGAVSGTISVQHAYAVAGTYNVTATATDASGQHASASIPVVVYAAVPFTLSVSASTSTATINVTDVVFTATPNPGAPSIQSYTWDFGDGTPPSTTTTPFTHHMYTLVPNGSTSQQVMVTVTASGSDGRVGYGSVVVTVTR